MHHLLVAVEAADLGEVLAALVAPERLLPGVGPVGQGSIVVESVYDGDVVLLFVEFGEKGGIRNLLYSDRRVGGER